MRYRLFIVVTALVLSVFPQLATSEAFPEIAGTQCSTTGAWRTVQKVSYMCVVVGKKRVWRKRSSSSTSSTTTSTLPKKSAAQVVAEKIDVHIVAMRVRSQEVPVIEYRFGASVSEADQAMTRQLAESFFKYGSFPQLVRYRNAIAVGLTNAEVVEAAAPWIDVSTWGTIAGGYSGTNTYSLVLQNFTMHRCGAGVTAADCAQRSNGGDLGRFRVRVNILHELSHGGKVALMGFDPTQSNRNLERMPMWLASGISNVQGAMLLAVIDRQPYVNPNISVTEASRCSDGPISATSKVDTGGGWGCKGVGTGDFANEILVARFGLDKVLEFVRESASFPGKETWSTWSSAWAPLFERLFLQTPTSFENDVETYRNAVIKATDLPPEFLDAKARS